MRKLIKRKLEGLSEDFEAFSRKISEYHLTANSTAGFRDMLKRTMQDLDYDSVKVDPAGNLIGRICGLGRGQDMILISHTNFLDKNTPLTGGGRELITSRAGIITSIYTGALVKNAIIPMNGDLIVCCVPRGECSDFGIKYLFDHYPKTGLKKIKGILLCEPTGFNVYLGHKGKIEYEIAVKGKFGRHFLEEKGINILGTMFPLINELEKVSKSLPSDCALGSSTLKIKDVSYSGYNPVQMFNEFKVVVDRSFVPEENAKKILNKAKTIARNLYQGESSLDVNTAIAKEKIKTDSGFEVISRKEFDPWRIESNDPFVLNSLEALKEGGVKSATGYWKNILTEGSYTFGRLGIPTIGFGAGSEELLSDKPINLKVKDLEKAVYGQTLIAYRNIGMPAFGWNLDEI